MIINFGDIFRDIMQIFHFSLHISWQIILWYTCFFNPNHLYPHLISNCKIIERVNIYPLVLHWVYQCFRFPHNIQIFYFVRENIDFTIWKNPIRISKNPTQNFQNKIIKHVLGKNRFCTGKSRADSMILENSVSPKTKKKTLEYTTQHKAWDEVSFTF